MYFACHNACIFVFAFLSIVAEILEEQPRKNVSSSKVSIMGFPVNQWLKSEEVSLFLNRCVVGGNPEALYREGMVEYFSSMRMEFGLEKLRRASEKGHAEASYARVRYYTRVYGWTFKFRGVQLLNAMKGSTTSQSTRLICNIPRVSKEN
ncbi:uncharacterized protein LOC131309530 [Rhododendron vialii]|uniref:uncharacterized protein LOC131309530 n=1 Tax=Rhododendron vialii TaxID=182163 RepID=UPI00265D788B|nr:uncharacterized protein LOC131309530 [Rhododendron vialii]